MCTKDENIPFDSQGWLSPEGGYTLRVPVSSVSHHSSLTNPNPTASRGTRVTLVCLATVEIPTVKYLY